MVDQDKIEFSLLFIGLDNSGKTLLIKRLNNDTSGEIIPTPGFEIHNIEMKGVKMIVYDCSGNGRHRENWRVFYEAIDGICFVIDTSDNKRTSYVKRAINDMMTDEQIIKKKTPIFFFLNKIDLDHVNTKQLIEDLDIKKYQRMENNPVNYKEISARKLYNQTEMEEAIEWLRDNRPKKKSKTDE